MCNENIEALRPKTRLLSTTKSAPGKGANFIEIKKQVIRKKSKICFDQDHEISRRRQREIIDNTANPPNNKAYLEGSGMADGLA
jgi:hypothetical protein